MALPVHINPGGPDDAAMLATFASRAFVAAYGGENPPGYVEQYVADAFSLTALRRDLNDPDNTFLLARSSPPSADQRDNLLGYVKLRWNRPIDELPDRAAVQLERIYVDQQSQSSGVGGRLLAAALRAARNAHARSIWLSVWANNERAQRFYRRNGFEIVGNTHFILGPERQEDFIFALGLD